MALIDHGWVTGKDMEWGFRNLEELVGRLLRVRISGVYSGILAYEVVWFRKDAENLTEVSFHGFIEWL